MDGCGPAKAYTACITDGQIRDELLRLVDEQGLTTDLAHIYPVFLPPKVQTQDLDGTYSGEDFCGYHRAFDTSAGTLVYGNEPFIKDGCGIGQAPNGSLAVDGAIDSLSHELSEALTDPLGDEAAGWTPGSRGRGTSAPATTARPWGTRMTPTLPAPSTTRSSTGTPTTPRRSSATSPIAPWDTARAACRNEQQALSATAGRATDVASVLSYVCPNTLSADGTRRPSSRHS